MLDPIATLTALNDRWPGFFDVIRSMNGWPVEGMTYDKILAVNVAMLGDDVGLAMLNAATALIMASEDPTHRKWREEAGFVSRATLEASKRLDAAIAAHNEGTLSDAGLREVIDTLKQQTRRRKELGMPSCRR